MKTTPELQAKLDRLAVVEATLRDYQVKIKTAVGTTDLNMYERGISQLHAEHSELRNQLTALNDAAQHEIAEEDRRRGHG